MKGLVLAAGRGERLKGTVEENKCLLKVYGTPVLEFSLNSALAIDVSEIVMVVGHQATDIINQYGNNFNGKKIRYVIQPEQKGLVHAIECARTMLGGADFALFLGDEVLVGGHHKEMLGFFRENGLFGVCGIVPEKEPEKIRRTYTVFKDGDGRVLRLVEKPRRPHDSWMGTGNCIFKSSLLKYIELTPVNPNRGEKELPDLIQCAIDDGELVKSFQVCDSYYNINAEKDLVDLLKNGRLTKNGVVELTS